MLSRLRRVVWTFCAVAGAYLAYSLLAVPFIEPPPRERSSLAAAAAGGTNTARKLRAARLEALFAPGDWELDNPMVLETDRGMLLIRDYQSRADGSLELKPCTLILYDTAGDAREEDRPPRYLLLRSPQGAVLHFDQPMDLTRGRYGRLEGGWLVGPVAISSGESSPGADDALDIRTGSVQINKQRITAPQEVIFRYGPNTGRGRDLIIDLELSSGGGGRSGPDAELQFGQIRSLELVHVDNIQLQFDDPRRAALEEPAAGEPAAAGGQTRGRASPVKAEITCRGPFRFDVSRLVATLEDQVQVKRKNLDGPDDLMSCDLVRIQFAADPPPADPDGRADEQTRTQAGEPPAAGLPNLSSFHARRLTIEGQPAVMDMPSEGIAARARLVEYSFTDGLVRVTDGGRAHLRFGQNEFEAASVEYIPAEQEGRLGRLLAAGPGRLRGATREEPDRMFQATWQDRLIIQPHQGEHAVSLLGEARVRYDELGEFAAEALHIWLHESPAERRPNENPRLTTIASPVEDAPDVAEPKPQRPRFTYEPTRMLAEGAVRLDSPQLAAQIGKVELWIRYAEAAPEPQPSEPQPPEAQPPAAIPRQVPGQRFELAGKHLQLQVVRAGSQTAVEHLILDGDVHLRELQTAKPGEVPLNLSGDLVQIESANTPRARLRIQGSPAEVSARGLAVSGGNIQLNREHNSLWILGPGSMTLPVPADRLAAGGASGAKAPLQTDPPTVPAPAIPLTVQWQRRMILDGRLATFEQQVELRGTQCSASGEEFRLLARGDELAVTLDRRVDFSANTPPDAQVDQALFRGPVLLQNNAHRLGVPTSVDRLQIRDLSLRPESGRLQASGPGWATSVRAGGQLPAPRRNDRSGSDSRTAQLSFLRVDFEDRIVGDIHNRDLEFRGRVRTLYGPVAQWDDQLDPEPRGGLDQGVFLLTCQRLALAQSPASAADVEVVADGNATVEGADFSARGWRVSYAQAKHLLILEGDGRSDAELWRKGSATPDAAAQQIRFWTNNNSIQVDGGRFFQLNHLGGLSP